MSIIAFALSGDRKKAQALRLRIDRRSILRSGHAFTLVELLVVIAIIGVLAGLVMPVLIVAKKKAALAKSVSNVRGIVVAAQVYGDTYKSYPWPGDDAPGAPQGELRSEDEARAALSLLYRTGCLEDPASFVSAAGTDRPAEPIFDPAERRRDFRLEEGQCSYTWRKRRILPLDDALVPVTGDRAPEAGTPPPLGALVVGFKGGAVESYDDELLLGPGNAKVRRAKAELIGWERVGGK